jgi:hypothetical protein
MNAVVLGWEFRSYARRPNRHSPLPAVSYMGEGGTIPFMAILWEKFPRSQFVVTGVLALIRTRMAPMNSYTYPPASASRSSSRRCWPTIMLKKKSVSECGGCTGAAQSLAVSQH